MSNIEYRYCNGTQTIEAGGKEMEVIVRSKRQFVVQAGKLTLVRAPRERQRPPMQLASPPARDDDEGETIMPPAHVAARAMALSSRQLHGLRGRRRG